MLALLCRTGLSLSSLILFWEKKKWNSAGKTWASRTVNPSNIDNVFWMIWIHRSYNRVAPHAITLPVISSMWWPDVYFLHKGSCTSLNSIENSVSRVESNYWRLDPNAMSTNGPVTRSVFVGFWREVYFHHFETKNLTARVSLLNPSRQGTTRSVSSWILFREYLGNEIFAMIFSFINK